MLQHECVFLVCRVISSLPASETLETKDTTGVPLKGTSFFFGALQKSKEKTLRAKKVTKT